MYNTLLMNNRTLYKNIGKLNNNIPHNNMITGRNGMIYDEFNDEGTSKLDAMMFQNSVLSNCQYAVFLVQLSNDNVSSTTSMDEISFPLVLDSLE